MQTPRTRRVQRVHLAQPILSRLGSTQVVLVDISVLGARIEHHIPLPAGTRSRLQFEWDGTPIVADCRIVRSRLERFSVGTDGLTVYHSGLEFGELAEETSTAIKRMIAVFISQALEEQKLNARGVVPQHDINRMPIFRFGGQLTSNLKDREITASPRVIPAARVAKETGYICYHFENNRWRRKRTHDPGQPADGFTISASEDHSQAELLCDAYIRSDAEGRRMIQLFAQLSIAEGEGMAVRAGFEP